MRRSRWVGYRSPLADGMRDFLAHKRALGRSFHTEERTLRLFDRYLAEQGAHVVEHITPAVVEAFLASRPRKRPRSYNHLLGTLRRLFDWLVAQEVLGVHPVHVRPRRETSLRTPFLFDVALAQRLLDASNRLPDHPRALGRGSTYSMIYALLFGLGLRVGEVSRLHRGDVDLDRDLLVIRNTKFSKSRLVPMGPRLARRLGEYLHSATNWRGPLGPEDPVFSFTHNQPIHPGTISQTFHHLIPSLHLNLPPGTSPPRVHDLRHSFAVETLLRWYRTDVDPGKRLIHLSTFLGHVDPVSTAVYLTITAELLAEASARFGRFAVPAFAVESEP